MRVDNSATESGDFRLDWTPVSRGFRHEVGGSVLFLDEECYLIN